MSRSACLAGSAWVSRHCGADLDFRGARPLSHEKRAFLPFLLGTPVMFILGAAFVYYFMLPLSMTFFVGFQTQTTRSAMGIQLQAKVSDYLDFAMTLIFAFGLTFQLPVLLSLLAKVGIVTARRCATCAATPLSACLAWPRYSPRRTRFPCSAWRCRWSRYTRFRSSAW